MADLPTEKIEEIIDAVEELHLMGYRKGIEVWRLLEKRGLKCNIKTIYKYKMIVQRRLRNRYRKIKLDKLLSDQLSEIEYMQKRAWADYQTLPPGNERTGCMNTILKCKERIAKLLGMDTENLNQGRAKTLEDLIREDDEKNEQTIDRGVVVDSKQTTGTSAVYPESSSAKV